MSHRRRLPFSIIVTVAVLAGCACQPQVPEPTTVVRVAVVALPAGVEGQARLTGPSLDVQVEGSREFRDVAPGSYTLLIDPVKVPGDAMSHPMSQRVDVDVSPGSDVTVTAQYGIVVPNTTKILDAADLDLTSPASGPVLVFEAEASPAAGIRPGDVLVAGIGPDTPEGLLRRVVAVRSTAGGIEVRTAPATLPDALPEGELVLRKRSFGHARVHNLRASSALDGTVEVSFDLPKMGTEAECGRSLTGGLDLAWSPTVDLDWKWTKRLGIPIGIERAKFVIAADYLLGLRYSLAEVSCSLQQELPERPIVVGTVALPIGPLVVVLSLTVQFVGSVELTERLESNHAFSLSNRASVGMEYRKGRLTPLVELPAPRVPEVAGSLEASAGAGLRVALRVYGITGPHLDLTHGFRVKLTDDNDLVGCRGYYGDIGWSFGPKDELNFSLADVIAVEHQLFPDYRGSCPLDADTRKLVARRRTVVPDDYRWMIGKWERTIDRVTDGEPLQRETLTVSEGGQVVTTRQSYLAIGYQDEIRCEGSFAFDENGQLVVNTSSGPPGYLHACHNVLDDQEIKYRPPTEGESRERIDWFHTGVLARPFHRSE